MANQLKMATVHSIQTLWQRGWSRRRIARTLGIHRETVGRYIRLAEAACATDNLTAGSGSLATRTYDDPDHSKPATPHSDENATAGNPTAGVSGAPSDACDDPDEPNRPNPTAGSAEGSQGAGIPSGPASRSEPFREVITAKLDEGLSAQRIWQDLVAEHGFDGSYQSVKRFVRRLKAATPLPFRRMECAPGAEAQVDFGTGAPVVTPEGEPLPVGAKTRRRKTHVFRIVLSHSRKGYSESVYRQTTDEFIRCLENAFHHFGGVPQTLVIDNLKAAVTRADWYDPELNPKLQSFCAHYGTVVLPTKPYTPRHKGKTERGIDYVQSNALKGRTFAGLEEQNRYLLEWETHIADTRIHGTTRRQVKKTFEEAEQPALQPLPVARFPSFMEGQRKVNRDGHVEVNRAYYSAPPEYLGRSLWARWDGRVVRLFNQRFEQVAIHAQREAGQFSTQEHHIPPQKRGVVEQGPTYLLNKARRLGSHSGRWAEQMLHQRGIEGVRVLQGLLSLATRHPVTVLERACEVACTHGAYRLRTIRALIKRQGAKQDQFAFIDEHPLIRPLSDYAALVPTTPTQESCP